MVAQQRHMHDTRVATVKVYGKYIQRATIVVKGAVAPICARGPCEIFGQRANTYEPHALISRA